MYSKWSSQYLVNKKKKKKKESLSPLPWIQAGRLCNCFEYSRSCANSEQGVDCPCSFHFYFLKTSHCAKKCISPETNRLWESQPTQRDASGWDASREQCRAHWGGWVGVELLQPRHPLPRWGHVDQGPNPKPSCSHISDKLMNKTKWLFLRLNFGVHHLKQQVTGTQPDSYGLYQDCYLQEDGNTHFYLGFLN